MMELLKSKIKGKGKDRLCSFKKLEIPSNPEVPLINIKLDQTLEVRALLDTGAKVNVMSLRVYRCLKNRIHHVPNIKAILQLKGAGGETIKITTMVHVLVEIKPQEFSVQNFYVADITEDVILGCPTIKTLDLWAIMQQACGKLEEVSKKMVIPLEVAQIEAMDWDMEEELIVDEKRTFKISDDPKLKKDIEQLMEKWSEIFSEKLPLGGAKVPAMEIKLVQGKIPKNQPPRRVGLEVEKAMRDQVGEMLKNNIIQESVSSYSSPVHMVRKKDRSWRFCIDYRHLNSCTEKTSHPLPNTQMMLERMAGSRIFAVLDLRSGFHQFLIAEGARKFTAFATPWKLYEFTRTSMGLSNSPGHFQKVFTEVMAGLVGYGLEIYVDDMIIHAATQDEFLSLLNKVFERLSEHDIRVKKDKCQIGLTQVKFLGHLVDGNGIQIDPDRKVAIEKMSKPTNVEELRTFLGVCGYVRPFIQDYGIISKELTKISAVSEGSKQFKWSKECDHSFDTIKRSIHDAHMLWHMDYQLQTTILRTDASTKGVGGTLLQIDSKGQERVIGYFSKAFDDVQKNWTTIEQECYAFVYGAKKFEHFLLGHKFTLETDHRNLEWMKKSSVPKIMRWCLMLGELEYDVRHIPGKNNIMADGLSRLLAYESPVLQINAESPINESDVGVNSVDIGTAHNNIVGHHGIQMTVEKLKVMGHKWGGMYGDVADYIKSCPACQKVMLSHISQAKGQLKSISSYEPFHTVCMDTAGPFPEDSQGNKYIICFVCSFTRHVELVAIKDLTAETAAKAMLTVFARYGAPARLHHDGGTQLTNKIISSFLKLVGVKESLSVPYHPQSNGLVERVNKEIKRHLQVIVHETNCIDLWSDYLPLIQRILNSTVHSSIGVSPSRLLYGTHINLNRNLMMDTSKKVGDLNVDVDTPEYIKKFEEAYHRINKAALEVLEDTITKRLEESPIRPDGFEVGDHVLVRPAAGSMGAVHKLMPVGMGPRLVVAKRGNVYTIKNLINNKTNLYDLSRLEKYNMDRTEDPLGIASRDQQAWPVESILEHTGTYRDKSKMKFLVKWLNFDESENSWVDWKVAAPLAALTQYVRSKPGLKLPVRELPEDENPILQKDFGEV